MSDRPLKVLWRDAYGIPDQWMHEDAEIPPPVIVATVGWIFSKRDGYTVIADSVFDTDEGRFYGGVTVIPDGMIVETTEP